MDFFYFTIYFGLMIVIQIIISLYIFDNVNMDCLAARFPFLKKKFLKATIEGFTMGNLGKVFDYPCDYLTIVSVYIGDVTYRTRIVRGESDEIGKDVEIIVYGDQISVAGRSERVVPYRKQNGKKLFNAFLMIGLLCSLIGLVLFHKLSMTFLVLLTGLLVLNYLMIPLYLLIRKKTWY